MRRVKGQTRTIALVFALALAAITAPKALRLGSPDFKVFHTAAQFALVDPAKMYLVSPDRYLYPPSAAMLLAPFALPDFLVAQWVWHGLLAFLIFLLAAQSPAALVAILLLTRYLTVTLAYGQINLPVIALLAGAGALLSRGRTIWSGGVWALATSLKVYPVIFAPAFLPKGNRKAVLAGAVTGLVILLLPFLFYGPTLGLDLYRQFFASLGTKGMPTHSHNQSWIALLVRLFTDNFFYLHAVGNAQWTLFALPANFVRGVAVEIGLIFAVLSWWKVLKEKRAEALSAAAFSILFFSHIVWKDYFLLLYFPLRELFGKLPSRQCWMLAGAYLFLVTISSHDILGPPLGARMDAACIHLWWAVLVWGAWWKA